MSSHDNQVGATDDSRPVDAPAAEQGANPSNEGLHQPRAAFDLTSNVQKNAATKSIVLIIGGAVAVFLVFLVAFWVLLASRWDSQKPDKVDESQVQADPGLVVAANETNPVAAWKQAQAKKEEEEARRRAREAQREQAQKPPSAVAAPPSTAQGSPDQPKPETPADRKLRSAVVATVTTMPGSGYAASSTGRSPGNQAGQPTSLPAGGQPSGEGSLLSGGGQGRGALGGLGASSFAASQAYLAPDGKYLLRNNTYARCALYTEVITEHESLLSCYLVSPLYSSDGSTLLADAGARMTGEQRIEMKPGQAQVFTQWNDLEVESGIAGVPNVRVRFDALGTGPMGASGTKGWIDNKYLERYGGALVLSGWKDLMQAGVNSTQNGDSQFSFNNSEQSVEDIASKSLDASINIKPVGYLLPGTVINVTIARDIDFSTVYENR